MPRLQTFICPFANSIQTTFNKINKNYLTILDKTFFIWRVHGFLNDCDEFHELYAVSSQNICDAALLPGLPGHAILLPQNRP
jgi:2-C-methyl-D-erythritol 4-phosphate cytidylyltransferase